MLQRFYRLLSLLLQSILHCSKYSTNTFFVNFTVGDGKSNFSDLRVKIFLARYNKHESSVGGVGHGGHKINYLSSRVIAYLAACACVGDESPYPMGRVGNRRL